MAIIKWQVRRETFKPDKNYFYVDTVEVSRETSEEEDRLNKLSSRYDVCGVAIGILGIVICLFGSISLGALHLWAACGISLVVGILSIFIGFCVLINKGLDCDRKLDKFQREHDVWNTPEVQEIERYTKEQNELAAKWRAEHPLEEKIRACLLDPKSSVDIANLARYYAETYLKEKTND